MLTMKTLTKATIKDNDLQLHLDDNKLITFKGITSPKQVPEYMISNLNYLINSLYIDSQVSIKVEKEKFPFTGWNIKLQSANLALTHLCIYYRNDTEKANIFGAINGYTLDACPQQPYKQAIKGLQKHVSAIL